MKSNPINKMKMIFCVVFSLFGIIMLIVAVFMKISFDNVKKNGISAQGYISDIVYEDEDNDVYITYEINGEEYTSQINYYTSSMNVGQRVTVYYYPENPGKIYYPTMLGPILTGGFGTVFLLVGVGFTCFVFREKSRLMLIDIGIRVMADVTYSGVGSLYVNNNRTYIVKAEWTDECGVLHKFKSQPMMENPRLIPNRDIVEVFVDPDNYKKYMMNI